MRIRSCPVRTFTNTALTSASCMFVVEAFHLAAQAALPPSTELELPLLPIRICCEAIDYVPIEPC